MGTTIPLPVSADALSDDVITVVKSTAATIAAAVVTCTLSNGIHAYRTLHLV
jgi:hypothetical protein